MKVTSLECIEPLLAVLRGYSALQEVATPHGIVADVRLARGQARLPVSTAGQHSALLGRIGDTWTALESRARRVPQG